MTHDQNKKTLRHFQCRDYLWEIFEQMSRELECSTDYLINEAMRQYARSRNYGTRSPSQQNVRPPTPSPQSAIPSLRSQQPRIPSAPPPPPQPRPPAYGAGGGYPPQPQQGYPPQQGGYPPQPQQGYPPQQQQPPPQQGYGGYGGPPSGGAYPPQPPQQRQSSYPPPRPGYGSHAPPPLPGAQGMRAAPAQQGVPPLFVIFNGQKIPISKAEFVIGRGSKTADLPIKDGNISRRHAAVVFENGAYYMKDLGSTNGVEFAGQRVDNKQVNEGDVFQICDYELRFTYR